MADSNFRGPINSMGALEVNAATTAVEPLDGPSMFYQGTIEPDLRSAPFSKDGFRAGQQPGFMWGSTLTLIDTIPQLSASTVIAAAQNGTAATNVAIATAQIAGVASAAGIAIGVPIVPLGTTVVTYANIALDFGFTTGSAVAGSTTIHTVDNSLFRVGQWIVVAGVGNATSSKSLLTQVASIPANTTAIIVTNAPASTIINIPIGQANLWGSNELPNGSQFGPATASANAHAFGGAMQAGLARVYNPREMSSRTLVAKCSGSVASYSALITGWDIWGAPVTELITMTTQTAVQGKKAFKYISHITCGTASPAGTAVAWGIGDNFGFPVRVDFWENTSLDWNGVTAVNNNGFIPAVTTPQTSTTGDVRGTFLIANTLVTGSGIATAASVTSANGTSRLTITYSPPVMTQILATPLNLTPKFGVAQSTATT